MFEDLRVGRMYVTEYGAYFCDIFRHDMNIVPDKAESFHMYVRDLNFSTRSYVFQEAKKKGLLSSPS